MSSSKANGKKQNRLDLPPLPSLRLEKQKLADAVYNVITDAIVSGKLLQGQRLREATVARELDVSRTPVREAFARLETEGLLERDPTGAYLVTTWDRSRLLELAIVRRTLECQAARSASRNLKAGDFDYLQSLVNRMEKAYRREEYPILVDLDLAFHSLLWEKSGLELLQDLLESIKTQIRFFMFLTLPGDEEEYGAMHQTLLDILREGNPDTISRAMRDHIIDTAEDSIANLSFS